MKRAAAGSVVVAVVFLAVGCESAQYVKSELAGTAKPEGEIQENIPPSRSVGKWVGDWESSGGRGSMEAVVDMNGDKVFGQVRATGSPGCSLEWEKLAGVAKGNKVFAHYNLGGRCGKVDIIYSIDQGGKVMTGSWSSQWPSYGTFRLTKQPTPPAAGAAEVAPITADQKQ